MKRTAGVFVVGSLLLALGTAVWLRAAEEGKKPPALPPLKIDRSEPLLLLDEPKAPQPESDKPRADNEPCLCCHRNLEDEELVHQHAIEDVGCMKCHGLSIDHRNDEDHVTPPDIMYPPEKIAAACKKCHETHDAPAAQVIATWQKKCPAKTNPDELVCTDCHGNHHLKIRTSIWDKRTRKHLGNPQLMKKTPEAESEQMK